MSIQGAVNSVIGGAETSIGRLKYFVNEDEKRYDKIADKYLQSQKSQAKQAGKEAKQKVDALHTAIDDKKKYWGANAELGKQKVVQAAFDATKAQQASAELMKNYVGLAKQREGSIFARARFYDTIKEDRNATVGLLEKYAEDSAVRSKLRAEKLERENK